MSLSTPFVRKPDRTVKARAAAALDARKKALAAYAEVTPIVLKLRDGGHSLRSIAGFLNGEAQVTRQGKRFSPVTVGRILARSSPASKESGAR